MVTGGNDKIVTVFNKESEQVVASMKGHSKKVISVLCHQDEVRRSYIVVLYTCYIHFILKYSVLNNVYITVICLVDFCVEWFPGLHDSLVGCTIISTPSSDPCP